MKAKANNHFEDIIMAFLGILGILAVLSIFEDDNSKIVSKKGRQVLSDENTMNKINKQIKTLEDSVEGHQHQEILI